MSVRIKYDEDPEFVKPKLEDLEEQTVSLTDYNLSTSPKVSSSSDAPINNTGSGTSPDNDNWKSWTLSMSLEGINPLVSGAEKFFKTLDNITKTIEQLLKIIRLLSGNVNSTSSLIKFAIKQLANEIKEFIDSLSSTGIYSSFIMPDFDRSFPKYNLPIFGGYQEFISRVNATCLSSSDPDAPRFVDKDKVGGVVIAMLGGVEDPDFLRNLMDNFKKLSNLFGFKIPYPAPATKLRVEPGFYKKDNINKLGVKITWEAPVTPVGSFYIYRTINNKNGVPVKCNVNGLEIDTQIFTKDDPIVKVEYNALKVMYSYIDFDVKPENAHYYKVYSVYGDDYLEVNSYLKAINSPIATHMAAVNVPKESIPVSELRKYMNQAISGEIISPVDLEGDWQSITVRRMLGSQIDSMYSNLDALTDKLLGLVNTGSTAINDYLKFYRERIEDLLEVITKIKGLINQLSAFTQRGTFMVLNLPIEEGGMEGFVDRFNTACNSGVSSETNMSKNSMSLSDFLKQSTKVSKNTPIATYNEKGIMFGMILLYGLPEMSDDRLSEIVPEQRLNSYKKQLKQSEKAIEAFLKILGLG